MGGFQALRPRVGTFVGSEEGAATCGARGSEGKARGLEGLTHGERWRRRAGGGMVGAPRASAPRDRPRPLCPGPASPQPLGEERSVEPAGPIVSAEALIVSDLAA